METNLPEHISAATSRFAAFTFEKRFPAIINQIKIDNQLSSFQEAELDKLEKEIKDGVVPHGKDLAYNEDRVFWEKFLTMHAGKNYAKIPFYEAEAYIYYRIVRIMDYPHSGLDPFEKLKSDGLKDHYDFVEALAKEHMQHHAIFDADYFTSLLHASLWANSADLSQLEANDALINSAFRGKLVIDDADRLNTLIAAPSTRQVDFVADNAGIELVSDLFLMDYLLNTGRIARINLHLKEYPIFVSDATIADVLGHLEILRGFQTQPILHFIDRLESHRREGRLNLCSHSFWNSPCHFTELPEDIKQGFDENTLLIIKGDANYRRLFEDRKWPYTTPLANKLAYLDRPCCSIRTLKSEIILGLSDSNVESLFNEDKDWLTNGRYGLIMVNLPVASNAGR